MFKQTTDTKLKIEEAEEVVGIRAVHGPPVFDAGIPNHVELRVFPAYQNYEGTFSP